MIFKEYIKILDCYFEWIDEQYMYKIPSFITITSYSKNMEDRFTFCLCERNNLILRHDVDINNKVINERFSKIRDLYSSLRYSDSEFKLKENIFVMDFINFLKIENRIINIDKIINKDFL
jgi:hypothetical protein